MDERTGQIRQEIEQTRARVGDEVEALSYKTDVGARIDDYVEDKKQAITSKARGAMDTVAGVASSVAPSRRARAARDTAERNPIGLVVGGVALGFVAGLLLPSTRVEEERIGEMGDRIRETAKDAGEVALERGKEVAQAAVETVKQEGGQQTRELASDLKERVQHESESESDSQRQAVT